MGQTISGASNSYGISGVDMLSREYVDTYGRKVLAIQADPNDLPGASNTAFAYSPLGELLTVTDPLGAVTSYTYDMAGRLLSEDHPDRGLTETAYDKASNVVGITNEATRALNGAITLDYDFNRLVNKTIAGSTGNDLYDIRYEYGNATSGSGKNGIGRVIKITQGEDATGNVFKTDHLKYDELGNVSVETKDFIVPNVGNRSYTTTKLYDSFGRIRRAVYPDGDQVSYGYTGFGELYSIASSLTGFPTQNIVSSVRYDGYGNIKTLAYGNGTQTDYTYSANTKSLFGSEVLGKVAGGTTNVSLMDRAYTYNGNGMISNMTRGIHTSLVSVGENVQTTAFEYDHLGRLGLATTSFAGTAGNQYSVSTSYNKAGGILDKVSTSNASAKVYTATAQDMNYDLIYRYSNSKPHQLEDVISSSGAPYAKSFVYNASGSISEITDMTGPDHSSFYWGQEQWLCGVQNSQGIHHYVYDHAGERVMKSSITQTTVQLNDQTINTVTTLEPYTLYVNPYYVITAFSNADRKSKHYYMGTQRVATDIGVEYWAGPTPQESMASSPNTTAKTGTHSGDATYLELTQSPAYTADLQRVLDQLSEGLSVAEVTMTSTPIEQFYPDLAQETAAETTESEPPLYSGSRILFWYHPDYVSNVDLVTDMTGASYELFLYNAWGENLHHWRSGSSNTWSSPYRFNSKELDPETGMHYYGARYHHPKLSLWMSVDPKAMSGDNMIRSPYNFTDNNPVILVDPDGNDIVFFNRQGKEVHRIESSTSFETYVMHKNADDHVMDQTHYESKAGWVQARMPNIIRDKGGSPTTTSRYQKLDYQIAASTHLFNEAKNDGTLKLVTEGNASIPTSALSDIPDLDPTLVKAVAMQESAIGSGGVNDVMQVNVSGDWNEFKSQYGLSKGGATNSTLSINAGIRVLATKGFKGGVDYNSTTGARTFEFQGWDKAVESYNGGGTLGYSQSVSNMINNSVRATQVNY